MSMASADPTSARPGRPVRDAGEMPCEFQAGQRLVSLQRGIQLECWRCNDVIFWPPLGRKVGQSVDGASEGEGVAIYVHIGTDIVIDIRIGGRSRPWIAKPLLVRRSGCDWRVGGCTDGRCAASGPCGNFVQTVQRGAALGQARTIFTLFALAEAPVARARLAVVRPCASHLLVVATVTRLSPARCCVI